MGEGLLFLTVGAIFGFGKGLRPFRVCMGFLSKEQSPSLSFYRILITILNLIFMNNTRIY